MNAVRIHEGKGVRMRDQLTEWLAALTVLLAVLGMALVTPPFAGPDEAAHQATANYTTIHIWPPKSETVAPTPGIVKLGDCTAFDSTKDASCVSPRYETEGSVRIFNYPPLYYWVVGLGQKAAPGANDWLDVGGRVASMLLTLCALAAVALTSRNRYRTWGSNLLAVTTPMAAFLWAVVNPNGWEITSGLLFAYVLHEAWSSSADPLASRRRQWLMPLLVAGTAIAFGLSKHDALVWLILLTLAVMLMSSRPMLSKERLILLSMTGLGVVGGLAWQISHPAKHPPHNPDRVADPTLWDHLHWLAQIDDFMPHRIRQMVGVLGSLDTPVPNLLVVAFFLAWAGLGGILYARQRVSKSVLALGFAGIFVAPSLLEVLRWNDWPFWWEGRITLAYAIPFLFLFLLRYGAKAMRGIQAVSLLSSFILLVMVWEAFLRYAYGVKDYIPLRWDHPAMGPWTFYGSILVIGAVAAVTVARCVMFFLSGRSSHYERYV